MMYLSSIAGRCPPAPNFAHSLPNDTSAEPGSVLIYRCVLGYMWPTRKWALPVKCENGLWNSTDAGCIGKTRRQINYKEKPGIVCINIEQKFT